MATLVSVQLWAAPFPFLLQMQTKVVKNDAFHNSMQTVQKNSQKGGEMKQNHFISDNETQPAQNIWTNSKCQRWHQNCRPHPFMHSKCVPFFPRKVQFFGKKYKFLIFSKVFDSFNLPAMNKTSNSFIFGGNKWTEKEIRWKAGTSMRMIVISDQWSSLELISFLVAQKCQFVSDEIPIDSAAITVSTCFYTINHK